MPGDEGFDGMTNVPPPARMDPAIAALLRERDSITDSLRKLNYVEPEQTPQVVAPEGFYPLHDFGKTAPPLDEPVFDENVDVETEVDPNTGRRQVKILGDEPVLVFIDEADDVAPTTIPLPGTMAPSTPSVAPSNDDAIIADAWRKSSVADREIMVGISSIGSGLIDEITAATNGVFHKGINDWTVRRYIYGKKAKAPNPHSLMGRGMVAQTNPYAGGRIKYKLTELGKKALEHGKELGKKSLDAAKQTDSD
jgi:hypothetical protein